MLYLDKAPKYLRRFLVMIEKIIGYILLVFGITVILYSAFNTYLVFTKQQAPIDLFNFSGISMDLSKFIPSTGIPAEYSQALKQTKTANSGNTEFIPPNMINQTSNIFAHLMLMGFLASIGYRLASLGINLIRPLVVHLKAKEVSVYEPVPPQNNSNPQIPS